MKRKCMALLTALVCCAAVCGCGDQGQTKEPETESLSGGEGESLTEDTGGEESVQMWDGYYQDTSTGMLSFVHFNEDGTYYAKYFEGGMTDAGTWELLEEETEYFLDGGADEDYATEEDNTKATAPQAIEMVSYTSGAAVKVAYDNDCLCDMSLGGMANHRTLDHNAEYAYNPDTDETAIELFVFYADNNIGSNFILSHNKTFVDVTGDAYQDGSWVMKGAGVYALTYSDGSEATLTIGQDGKSASLAKADGSETQLSDTYGEDGDTSDMVVLSLRAEDAQVGLPMGVNLRLDCYGDNTCKLIVEVAQVGAELEADTGTYSVSETYQYTFTFEKAGEVTGTPDYASATESSLDVEAVYKAETEVEFNGGVTPLSIDSSLKGTYSIGGEAATGEAQVVTTLLAEDAQVGLPMGVELRIDCYDDNTCKLIVAIAQIDAELEADSGTFDVSESYRYTFTFEKAGEVVAEPDYANASAEGLPMTVAYKADTEVEFNGAQTPLSIDAVLEGFISAQ